MKPNDIVNFVQGNLNYIGREYIPDHIVEQAEHRARLCKPCLIAKKCPHCPCKVPNMFYAPKKVCKGGKWGKMVGPTEWNKIKEEYITHNKRNEHTSKNTETK